MTVSAEPPSGTATVIDALLVGIGDAMAAGMTGILAPLGTITHRAKDVAAAMSAEAGRGPAALVVIATPPGESLSEACRSLRRHPPLRDAIILVIVPDDALAHVSEVLAAGASDYFPQRLGEALLRARLRVARHTAGAHAAHTIAEDLRHHFFELSIDLLCVAGVDGRFRYVNPAWTRVLGWSSEELCARPWLDFVHPDDLARTIVEGEGLGRGVPVVTFQNRYRHKSGVYRWLDWRSSPSLPQGLVYCVARDVTDERERARVAHEFAENLSATLDSIGDAVIATDGEGIVTRINPVAERLTGWTAAEATGRPIAEVFVVVHERTRAPVQSPVEQALRDGHVVMLAEGTLLVRRDETEVPIADSCAPIRDLDGASTGAVLVFRDLSAERAAAALQSSAQAQLVFADRMASVGTLAAGMAHEINNPLAYISTNLEMLLEDLSELAGGSSSARMRELTEMASDALDGANRIRKIVRGLKTFSRPDEERRSVIHLQPVLEVSINMAFNEIRHRARLVKDYGTVPLVEADEARLTQVFINLLVNAAQALPEGGAAANEIRIRTATDDRGRAVVEVEDNGPGIPASVLQRIFDPFFTTKEVGTGTGLGLSICRNIVTALGGEITVTSLEGRGTTFRVALPPASSTALAMPDVRSTSSAPAPLRGSVLIVDDEPAIGAALGRVLRDHEVTFLTRAKEALALLLADKEYDVILSDLMMPEMSGIDLYDALATSKPEMARRMVFVTGGAFTPAGSAFFDRVSNERLEKPVDSQQLRALVRRFLQQRVRSAETL